MAGARDQRRPGYASGIEDLEGFDEPDEYNEYLSLWLEGGGTATFRNSHVDLFQSRA